MSVRGHSYINVILVDGKVVWARAGTRPLLVLNDEPCTYLAQELERIWPQQRRRDRRHRTAQLPAELFVPGGDVSELRRRP